MGLDQYAYAAGQENSEYGKQKEIAYWRKHPNLQGWMENLARKKGLSFNDFNGVELELTWEDIDLLEKAVSEKALPYTQGFFFGQPSDDHYRDHDLEFCRNARADLFVGLRVFYNSSW